MHEVTEKSRLANLIPYAITGIILITLLASIGSTWGWHIYLELASHFQRQYAIVCLLLCGLLVFATRQKLSIAIALCCLVIVSIGIIPWYIPQTGIQNDRTAKLRVLSFNVYYRNRKDKEVLSFVRKENPNVAVFIEVSDFWQEKLEALKDILPYATNLASPNLDIKIFSQMPIENASIKYFGTGKQGDRPPRGSIVGDLTINGQVVSLIATHLPVPIDKPNFRSRNMELEAIGKFSKSLANPFLVVGDFNSTMWSPYFRKFMRETGLHNARQGFGILPTWPTGKYNADVIPPFSPLWLLSIPIDHCLISPSIRVTNMRTGPNVGSDHLPLITDLAIPSNKAREGSQATPTGV